MENKETIRNQIHQLIDIAFATNGFENRRKVESGTMPTVFFQYSGHVNRFCMDLYPDGWEPYGTKITLIDTDLTEPLSESVIQSVQDECSKALTEEKESEVLARDIDAALTRIAEAKENVKQMKNRLRKLQNAGR